MNRIVVTHHNADLDALACLVAASKIYGATPVVPNFVSPAVRRYLALHKDHLGVKTVADLTDSIDEVVIVDVRDRRRLTDTLSFIDNAARVVVWDHHPPGPEDVTAAENHVELLGACITLLLEKMIEVELEPTPSEATLFLLGLYSDTGRLSFASTQPRDAKMASYLLSHGANLRVASRYLRHIYSHDQVKLLTALLASCEEVSVDRVEVAFCTASAPKYVNGASVVVQQVMEFGGHDAIVAVLGFEKNDRVQVIARSRVSHVDVGELARRLGGGGHHGAAAATFKRETVDSVLRRAHQTLEGMALNAARVGDLMSSPVRTLDADATLSVAWQTFESHNISGAPVMRDGVMVGVLSRRDARRAQRSASLELPVGSHMTHHVRTIEPHEPVEDALDLMTEFDVGRLVVVHEGELVGILTRSDVLHHLYLTALDDSDLIS